MRYQLRMGDTIRYFNVHLPHQAIDKKLPVVFNFHGMTGTAEEQEEQSGMTSLADREGFIAVYPQGMETDGNTAWNSGCYIHHQVDDIAFIKAMVHKIRHDLPSDKKRFYATGFSMGGFMCQRLAMELSPMFAAVASVAGQLGYNYPWEPEQKISVMHIHNRDDDVDFYGGDKEFRYEFAPNDAPQEECGYSSVMEMMEFWRNFNNCGNESREDSFTLGDYRGTTEQWCNRAEDIELKLISLEKGGHCWPPFTSELVWDFFKDKIRT